MMAKYMEVYYDILNKMEKRIYPPMSKLPSEKMMMDEYQVSRDTVRKALAMLLQNGYIQKSQGKAPIVLDNESLDFPVSTLTTFTELAEKTGMHYETIVETFETVKGNPEAIEKLQINPEDEAYHLVRVRKINGERIILDKDYINCSYVPGLTKEISKGSIYRYFEDDLGLKISFAKKEIIVRPVSSEDKRLLDMKDYDMIVIVRSSVYLEDLSLFQYSESRHRPDKFVFTDFARRMPASLSH